MQCEPIRLLEWGQVTASLYKAERSTHQSFHPLAFNMATDKSDIYNEGSPCDAEVKNEGYGDQEYHGQGFTIQLRKTDPIQWCGITAYDYYVEVDPIEGKVTIEDLIQKIDCLWTDLLRYLKRNVERQDKVQLQITSFNNKHFVYLPHMDRDELTVDRLLEELQQTNSEFQHAPFLVRFIHSKWCQYDDQDFWIRMY